jgi:hypothetical protein
MSHATPSRRRQVAEHRQRLQQAAELPFARLLQRPVVEQALREERGTFRDRLWGPLVTSWVLLSQVPDPGHSCRQAGARFCAWRAAQHRPPCAADPSASCKARRRLPEGPRARLTGVPGRQAHDQAPPGWRWQGHPLKVVDGTTVSMPDTEANQQAFPQANTQKPGPGFPIARLVVAFSLAVGSVLDAALGRCQGKQTGETALFHTLHDTRAPGDWLVADR